MPGKFSSELQVNVWDDDQGTAIKVGHDSDSLGLVMIKPLDSRAEDFWGKFTLCLQPEQARLLAQAMVRVADDIESKVK